MTCSVDGCSKAAKQRGMCYAHYSRQRRHGDVHYEARRSPWVGPIDERIWGLIDVRDAGDCWPWVANRLPSGYGKLRLGGRTIYGHRAAYEVATGAHVGAELDLHHTCEHPWCCNPAHLVPLTKSEHRTIHGGPTHCKRGHPYDEVNTYVNPKGVKVCRACMRQRHQQASKRQNVAG